MNYSSRIKKLMRARNLTVYSLSKKSGLSESALRNMLSRGTNPSLETVEKLCQTFKITLSEFFLPDEHELIEISPKEKELLDAYREADRREKKFIERSAGLSLKK